MKHKYYLAGAFLAAFFLSACSKGEQKTAQPVAMEQEKPATEAVEETSTDNNLKVETKEFEKTKGDNELEIEYPVSGNPEVVQSIRKWMNEQLSETFRGNLDDPEAFFRHYAAQLGTDPDLNDYGGFTQDKFDLEYQNDLIVTYDHTSYIYEGGAHGMGGEYGTTFLKADGSIFTWNCFTGYKPLKPLFIAGLKRYFKVKTDAELADCLYDESTLKTLSAPGMQPGIFWLFHTR